jgi:16S rRNA (uracil1498-N3)-methyltransferase
MRLTRCYVPMRLAPQSELSLPAGASAHVAKVLRLRAGAELTLFDGHGGESTATILACERTGVRVRIGAHRAVERESPLALQLLQCLLRGERMDLVVQKATELGATTILPLQSRHGIVRLEPAAAARRHQHWQAIVIGACEQCGRNRLPELGTLRSFEQACGEAAGSTAARLLLDPAGSHSLAEALQPLSVSTPPPLTLLLGPEGGLSDDELLLAQRCGFSICRLGPRVLRAETAPVAALATVQSLLGDFGARGTGAAG